MPDGTNGPDVQEPTGEHTTAADKASSPPKDFVKGYDDLPRSLRGSLVRDKEEAHAMANAGDLNRSVAAYARARLENQKKVNKGEIDIDEFGKRETNLANVYGRDIEENVYNASIRKGGLSELVQEATENAIRQEFWAQVLEKNPDAKESGWDADALIRTEDEIPQYEKKIKQYDMVIAHVKDNIQKGTFTLLDIDGTIQGHREQRAALRGALQDTNAYTVGTLILKAGLKDPETKVGSMNDGFVVALAAEKSRTAEIARTRQETLDRLINNAFPGQQAEAPNHSPSAAEK